MASPELKYPRHPVATSGFHPVDYLRLMGHDVTLERCEHFDYGFPTFEFVMYGHFLVAEVLTIVDGSFKKDFKDLLRAKPTSDECFSMQRRLMAVQKIKTKSGGTITRDSVPMPWLLTIDGLKYQVKVCWMDSCAVHGTVSYSISARRKLFKFALFSPKTVPRIGFVFSTSTPPPTSPRRHLHFSARNPYPV